MQRARSKLFLATIPSLLICLAWGCAHAQPSQRGAVVLATSATTGQDLGESATEPPDSPPPASTPPKPTPAERLEALRRLVDAELADPKLGRTRVSLLAAPAAGGAPILSIAPDERRVPASNAKLFTSAAAALLLGRYSFVTEVSRAGTRLYLWSSGDPVMRGRHLDRLARQLKARGVTRVRHIVVDDSHFNRRRLAPGFNKFGEGAYYRPTSGALNVDGNVVVVKVSTPKGRRRPRVDVTPPSDYVKVRKLVKFERRPRRRGKRGGRRTSRKPQIKVQIRPRGAIMWVTVSGTVPRKMRRPWYTRRAVYDPGLNAGWALRRSLVKAGVQVEGIVSRGRRPKGARPLVRSKRSLGAILAAVNRDSDNLAAETLVRAMGASPAPAKRAERGSWGVGLARLQGALNKVGITAFQLGNGSGLHRHSWVTASALVELLQKIHAHEGLRARIVRTMAVAGRSGTLRRRMRGTPAEGLLVAKTGTLAGVLALSGFIAPGGSKPLAFSVLFNGRSDRVAREVIDRVAVHLARYSAGLPMDPDEASTRPTTQPSSAPSTSEATKTPTPDAPPSTAPTSQPSAPASQPAASPEAVSETP